MSNYDSLKIVENKDDVYNIPETECFYSVFSAEKNIGKNELIALLTGKALVDISDRIYYHWLQLDDEALSYVKNILPFISNNSKDPSQR